MKILLVTIIVSIIAQTDPIPHGVYHGNEQLKSGDYLRSLDITDVVARSRSVAR